MDTSTSKSESTATPKQAMVYICGGKFFVAYLTNLTSLFGFRIFHIWIWFDMIYTNDSWLLFSNLR